MKKGCFLLLITLIFTLLFTGCVDVEADSTVYTPEGVTELTYCKNLSLKGKEIFKIDFIAGKVYRKSESGVGSSSNGDFEEINTFTPEEGQRFLNDVYEKGFFAINKSYHKNNVLDGAGWEVNIKYADGKLKKSTGYGFEPNEFNECAIPFYDICGVQVLGELPRKYLHIPNVTIVLKSNGFTDIGERAVLKADYYWNNGKSSSDDDNYYLLHEANAENEIEKFEGIAVAFSTSRYDDEDERFKKFIFKSYDYVENMANETIIAEEGWFGSDKILTYNLEANKIYVYELQFQNGEYVRYTFDTKIKDTVVETTQN